MPTNEYTPDIAALKSGLPIFYGRILRALERIADAQEATRRRVDSLQPLPATKRGSPSDG